MYSSQRTVHALRSLLIAVLILCVIPVARAGEVETLLRRGLPTVQDPAAGLRSPQAGYPLRPLDRLPAYGLPYGLLDTTTRRLAFRVDDLTLPGYLPIQISRFYDSGGNTDIPSPIEGPTRGGAKARRNGRRGGQRAKRLHEFDRHAEGNFN